MGEGVRVQYPRLPALTGQGQFHGARDVWREFLQGFQQRIAPRQEDPGIPVIAAGLDIGLGCFGIRLFDKLPDLAHRAGVGGGLDIAIAGCRMVGFDPECQDNTLVRGRGGLADRGVEGFDILDVMVRGEQEDEIIRCHGQGGGRGCRCRVATEGFQDGPTIGHQALDQRLMLQRADHQRIPEFQAGGQGTGLRVTHSRQGLYQHGKLAGQRLELLGTQGG